METDTESKTVVPFYTKRLGALAIDVFGRDAGDFSIKDWGNFASFDPIIKTVKSMPELLEEVRMMHLGFNARVTPSILASGTFFESPVAISTSQRCDGMLMEPKEVSAIVSSDCPTIVVFHSPSGKWAMLHGARDSLMPLGLRHHKIEGRSVEHSVIEELFKTTGWKADDLLVSVHCGIGPEKFSHPPYERLNAEIIEYIRSNYGDRCLYREEDIEVERLQNEGDYTDRIDLYQLIKWQFRARGVKEESIMPHDGIDTALNDSFYSVRGKKPGMNLVLVRPFV